MHVKPPLYELQNSVSKQTSIGKQVNVVYSQNYLSCKSISHEAWQKSSMNCNVKYVWQ